MDVRQHSPGHKVAAENINQTDPSDGRNGDERIADGRELKIVVTDCG